MVPVSVGPAEGGWVEVKEMLALPLPEGRAEVDTELQAVLLAEEHTETEMVGDGVGMDARGEGESVLLRDLVTEGERVRLGAVLSEGEIEAELLLVGRE